MFVDDLMIDAFDAGGATISATRTADGLSITFTGVLESADNVTGTWTTVQGATNPLAIKPDQAMGFYRAPVQQSLG